MNTSTISAAVRKKLLKILHARSEADTDMDELNAVFLQIVLAVMLIFMIAFFLFMSKVGGEISKLDQLKEKAIQAEKEKILQTVEKIVESSRLRYGLKDFLRFDPLTGSKEYEFSGVLENGRISGSTASGKACRIGWKQAGFDYADQPALEKKWLAFIGKSVPGAENTPFAAAAVHDAVLRLKHEICEVQLLCAAALQEQLASAPASVADPEISALIRKISSNPSSSENQEALKELNLRLKRYVYDMISRQCGTKMLEE